jgi:NodT family efflux transporter outer membrane factor (OMF) lipoprotein
MHNYEDTKQAMHKRLPAFVGMFSLLGALGGCSVGPDFKKPEVPVNEAWRAQGDPRITTQTVANAQWWKTFNDSALDRLIEIAYRQNLPLQIAGLRIAEARAQLGIATGKQYPQVQVAVAGGSAEGLTQHQADIASIDRNFFTYQAGFDAVWELDFWGKYRRGVQAEAANLLATEADYDSSLVTLMAEVARTYAVIRTFEVLIDQADQNTKVQEDELKIAESRFKNGATSELDVTQATSLLESTRAIVPKLKGNEIQARNALTTLLGQPTGTVDTVLAAPGDIPKAPDKVAVSLPAELLRRRPDIRSAELFAAAQCARIGVAKAELYPSFSLFGSVGLQANSAGSGSHNLFSASSIAYSIGPRIVFPFLNYGRLTNNVRVEDARFQQSLVSYRNTVLKAAQEVEDALTGFLNSQEAIVFDQRAVAAAQRSAEISVVQYRDGAVDYQRVLDSQRFLLQEENDLAQTRSSVAVNAIALYKALGGGWELRQGQAVISDSTQKEMKDRTDWGEMLAPPPAPPAPRPPPATPKTSPETQKTPPGKQ